MHLGGRRVSKSLYICEAGLCWQLGIALACTEPQIIMEAEYVCTVYPKQLPYIHNHADWEK